MRTYEQVIAEHPKAAFFIENIDYLCHEYYPLEQELIEHISLGNEKPRVWLASDPYPATEDQALYSDGDFSAGDLISDRGEEINIDNLWEELKNEIR